MAVDEVVVVAVEEEVVVDVVALGRRCVTATATAADSSYNDFSWWSCCSWWSSTSHMVSAHSWQSGWSTVGERADSTSKNRCAWRRRCARSIDSCLPGGWGCPLCGPLCGPGCDCDMDGTGGACMGDAVDASADGDGDGDADAASRPAVVLPPLPHGPLLVRGPPLAPLVLLKRTCCLRGLAEDLVAVAVAVAVAVVGWCTERGLACALLLLLLRGIVVAPVVVLVIGLLV